MSRALAGACETVLGRPMLNKQGVGGGSISAAWHVETSDGPAFVKETGAAQADWFAAEADGLAALARCDALRVPEVLGTATNDGRAFLFLSWIEMRRAGNADDERCGQALAALHAIESPRYGWARDNYIGATPQLNGWYDDWAAFVRERRIAPQLELATRNGFGRDLGAPGERVLARIDEIVGSGSGAPALLHGDLWSGNRGVDAHGVPVLFDPAVHFGDGESDMAMTELFGGFGRAFYSAYESLRPATGDVRARRDLYRLYHVLNHVNLFGGGYLSQALALMRRLGG